SASLCLCVRCFWEIDGMSPGLSALVGVFAAGLLGGCASVPPGDAADALVARFDSLRREKGIPGLAVVVLRDTTVVLARGLGYADLERRVPVTPETPFNVASVAKPISAVVA